MAKWEFGNPGAYQFPLDLSGKSPKVGVDVPTSPAVTQPQSAAKFEGVAAQQMATPVDNAGLAEIPVEEWVAQDAAAKAAGEPEASTSWKDLAGVGLQSVGGMLAALGEGSPGETAYNLPGAGSGAPGLTGVSPAFRGKQQISPRQSLALALLGR